MRPSPLIQRLISHFFEIPVAEFSSPHNKQLKVVLHRGRYKLTTLGAVYSFSDLYSNFRKCFEMLDWDRVNIRSCLVLGLGLGSIPDMLVSKFKKDIDFTAVEVDECVIQLASQYVLKPKKISVNIFTADATQFVLRHGGRYDMICSDVFIGDRIPQQLQTVEALTAMRDMLTPNGLLLYNRLSRYEPDRKENLAFMEDVFLKVFPQGGYLDVDGNWMYVNRPGAFTHRSL